MARILTVDDSRSVRMIVTKQLADLGLEIEEAENGEDGLAKLEDLHFDLVLLDVTMPVLDGPGMLERMRSAGNTTPVLMLTSESKRSTMTTLIKLGISGYILKPFRPEELREKVCKALNREDVGAAVAEPAIVAAPQPASSSGAAAGAYAGAMASPSGARQFVDVLVIDDMDNVQKKLRTLLPERLSMNSCTSAQAAMALCRERVYRVALVDKDLPEVSGGGMIKHLKVLQPHAAFVAMALRSSNDITAEAKGQGFDGVLYKPFTQDSIEDFLVDYFDTQDVTQREDNLVRITEFRGRRERIEKYYKRLLAVLREDLQYMAEACFEDVILDASKLAFEMQKSPQLIRDVAAESERLGVQLRLVGDEELQKCLKSYTETSAVAFYAQVSEAKQAAA